MLRPDRPGWRRFRTPRTATARRTIDQQRVDLVARQAVGRGGHRLRLAITPADQSEGRAADDGAIRIGHERRRPRPSPGSRWNGIVSSWPPRYRPRSPFLRPSQMPSWGSATMVRSQGNPVAPGISSITLRLRMRHSVNGLARERPQIARRNPRPCPACRRAGCHRAAASAANFPFSKTFKLAVDADPERARAILEQRRHFLAGQTVLRVQRGDLSVSQDIERVPRVDPHRAVASRQHGIRQICAQTLAARHADHAQIAKGFDAASGQHPECALAVLEKVLHGIAGQSVARSKAADLAVVQTVQALVLRPDPQRIVTIDEHERASPACGHPVRERRTAGNLSSTQMQQSQAAARLHGTDPYRAVGPDIHALQDIDRACSAASEDSGRQPGARRRRHSSA